MSALPVEQQPSGTTPADTGRESRGPRPRLASAPARRDGHPLFPSKRAVLPDGDSVFPGGEERFSGASQSSARRPSRPAGAGRGPAGSVASSRQVTGTAAAAGAGAGRIARAAPPVGLGRPVLGRPVPVGRPAPAAPAAGAVPSRRIRLTRRGRIVVAALAVVAACGLFVAGASAAQASSPAARAATGSGQQIIVQPGSTLWSIAQSADPHADARTVVQEMLQATRLKTADITAGQRLWVPRG